MFVLDFTGLGMSAGLSTWQAMKAAAEATIAKYKTQQGGTDNQTPQTTSKVVTGGNESTSTASSNITAEEYSQAQIDLKMADDKITTFQKQAGSLDKQRSDMRVTADKGPTDVGG